MNAVVPNPTTWTGDGSVEPIPEETDLISKPVPTVKEVEVMPVVLVSLNVSCARILIA